MKRVFILMTAVFAALFVSCGENNHSVRFDGVYNETNYGSTTYLRFYEDSTVISMVAEGADLPAKERFQKDNKSPYLSKGKYKIEGKHIFFNVTDVSGTVVYAGTIYDDKLVLSLQSLINGNTRNNVENMFSAW